MDKKETILLDACLISVIDNNAFGAELRNGHRFVAFSGRGKAGRITPKIGEQVRIEMSPYDMSKGRLVLNQEQ
jgi:translation initiation factor IF-1